ncbi:TPA_asm: hypothetical protein [Girado virus 1]|nr:TPA_asm: hypothetical protein [Girado virus 1]
MNSTKHRTDKHLNTCITYRQLDYLRENIEKEKMLFPHHLSLVKKLGKENLMNYLSSSDYEYSGFQFLLIKMISTFPFEKRDEYSLYRSMKTAEECLSISHTNMYKINKISHPYTPANLLSEDLSHLFQWKVWYHQTIQSVSNTGKAEIPVMTCFGATLLFNNDLCLLLLNSNSTKINKKIIKKRYKNLKEYNENRVILRPKNRFLINQSHLKDILKKIREDNKSSSSTAQYNPLSHLSFCRNLDFRTPLKKPSHSFGFHIMTYDHFLNMSTIINGIFNLVLYLRLAEVKFTKYNKSFVSFVRNLIGCLLLDIVQNPQLTYQFIKFLSPFIIYLTIVNTNNDIHDQEFVYFIENQISQFKGLHSLDSILKHKLQSANDISSLLELTGLSKLMGFPVINVIKSCENILNKGRLSILADNLELTKVGSFFKKEFIINYIKREKKSPKIKTGSVNPILEKLINNCDVTNLITVNYLEFEKLSFDQTLLFDYCIDPTDLLSDKSIIQSLDQWIYEYKIFVYKRKYSHVQLPPRKTKRLLIKYLSDEKTNIKAIIDDISNGKIDEQDNIIVMTFKEKELKIDNARGFGKMSYNRRLYQTCTEFNLKQSLFKYFPEQSMTYSENKLLKRLIELNYSMINNEDSFTVFLSFDFSSWCTTMTFENTFNIFYEIDNIFGLKNVYTFSHILPYLCTFIIQDPYFPPKMGHDRQPEESINSTRFYFKWIEGQRQKGWTLITMMFLKMIISDLGFQAEYMGQGDNQIAILHIPKYQINKSSIGVIVANLIKEISLRFSKIGLILKAEETWYSMFLFEYSKKHFYKGLEISSTIKKVIRLGLDINDGIYTFSNALASIFSSGISIAGTDVIPDLAYYMSVFEASFLLDQVTNGYLTLQKLIISMLISRELGGYPIVIYSLFTMKGNMDPLTNSVSLVKTLIENSNYSGLVLRFLDLRPSPNRDYLLLIKDPFSLNIGVPKQIENIIRSKNEVPKIIKNQEILHLFSQDIDTEEENLIKDLLSIQPCNPRLYNYLYKLSNVSLREKITSRFTNTRSLMHLLDTIDDDTGIYSFIDSIREYDDKMIYLYNARFDTNENFDDNFRLFTVENFCSTETSQYLRNTTWGLNIEDVTMPAIHDCYIITRSIEKTDNSSSFTIYADPLSDKHNKRGLLTPYIGTNTRERIRRSNLEIIAIDNVVKSIKKILKIKSWICNSNDTNLNSFINSLLYEKTNIDISELIPCQDSIIGGCLAHRLRDEVSPKGSMINSLSNFSTHIKIITDTALLFSKSAKDYSLCFQSILLIIIACLNLEYFYNSDVCGMFYTKITCYKCIHEIKDSVCTMDESSRYKGIVLKSKIDHISTKEHNNFIGYRSQCHYDISIIYSQKVINYLNEVHNYQGINHCNHTVGFFEY